MVGRPSLDRLEAADAQAAVAEQRRPTDLAGLGDVDAQVGGFQLGELGGREQGIIGELAQKGQARWLDARGRGPLGQSVFGAFQGDSQTGLVLPKTTLEVCGLRVFLSSPKKPHWPVEKPAGTNWDHEDSTKRTELRWMVMSTPALDLRNI